MFVINILYVIIVTYIVAKVLSVIIRFVRQVMHYARPDATPKAGTARDKKPMPYTNVEDVDYEDITDKK
jgi:hypothetical protein